MWTHRTFPRHAGPFVAIGVMACALGSLASAGCSGDTLTNRGGPPDRNTVDSSVPEGGTADSSSGMDAGPNRVPNGTAACAPAPEVHGDVRCSFALALGSGQLAGAATDSSNNIVIAGSAISPLQVGSKTLAGPDGGGFLGPFVLKLDPSGNLLWYRTFVGQGNVQALGLDAHGDIYLAGDFNGSGANRATLDFGNGVLPGSLFVAKLDPTGKALWSHGYPVYQSGSAGLGANLALAVDAAGDVAIMSEWIAPTDFGGGVPSGSAYGGFVVVFDPSGKHRFTKGFNGTAAGASAQFDATGNLAISGSFTGDLGLGAPLSSPNATSAFAAKLDLSGNVIWQQREGDYSGAAAVAAGASTTYFAGNFSGSLGIAHPVPSHGGYDPFVAALDAQGQPIFETPLTGGADLSALASDPAGGVVTFGQVSAVSDFGGGLLTPAGIVLAKLDALGHHVFSARFGVPSSAAMLAQAAKSVAVDTAGGIVTAGAFLQAIDLGAGTLTEAPDPSFDGTMFVAKYVEQPYVAPAGPARACPLALDAGLLPDAGALVTVTSSEPVDLKLGTDTVYWITGSEVMSRPIAGGDPTILAFDQRRTIGLANDSLALYWANAGTTLGTYPGAGPGGDGEIVTMPLDGGAIAALASGQDAPHAIAIDDAGVYWTAGSTPTLADGGDSTGAVLTVPLQGGTPTVLVSGLIEPGPIAVRGGIIVFASAAPAGAPDASPQSTPFQIASVSRDGGAPTVLATTDRRVGSIALNDVTVFWTDESTHGVDTSNSDGRVRSVPLAGGTASVLLDHQDGPSQMVLWDKTLFFTTAGGFSNAGPSNNAGLYGLPVTGGVATPVVHGRPSLGALAVDGSHIAWADDLDPSNNLWGIFVAPQ